MIPADLLIQFAVLVLYWAAFAFFMPLYLINRNSRFIRHRFSTLTIYGICVQAVLQTTVPFALSSLSLPAPVARILNLVILLGLTLFYPTLLVLIWHLYQTSLASNYREKLRMALVEGGSEGSSFPSFPSVPDSSRASTLVATPVAASDGGEVCVENGAGKGVPSVTQHAAVVTTPAAGTLKSLKTAEEAQTKERLIKHLCLSVQRSTPSYCWRLYGILWVPFFVYCVVITLFVNQLYFKPYFMVLRIMGAVSAMVLMIWVLTKPTNESLGIRWSLCAVTGFLAFNTVLGFFEHWGTPSQRQYFQHAGPVWMQCTLVIALIALIGIPAVAAHLDKKSYISRQQKIPSQHDPKKKKNAWPLDLVAHLDLYKNTVPPAPEVMPDDFGETRWQVDENLTVVHLDGPSQGEESLANPAGPSATLSLSTVEVPPIQNPTDTPSPAISIDPFPFTDSHMDANNHDPTDQLTQMDLVPTVAPSSQASSLREDANTPHNRLAAWFNIPSPFIFTSDRRKTNDKRTSNQRNRRTRRGRRLPPSSRQSATSVSSTTSTGLFSVEDVPLDQILTDSDLCNALSAFLVREFATENLLFLRAAGRYQAHAIKIIAKAFAASKILSERLDEELRARPGPLTSFFPPTSSGDGFVGCPPLDQRQLTGTEVGSVGSDSISADASAPIPTTLVNPGSFNQLPPHYIYHIERYLHSKARVIVDDFFASGAPNEINVPAGLRKRVMKAVQDAGSHVRDVAAAGFGGGIMYIGTDEEAPVRGDSIFSSIANVPQPAVVSGGGTAGVEFDGSRFHAYEMRPLSSNSNLFGTRHNSSQLPPPAASPIPPNRVISIVTDGISSPEQNAQFQLHPHSSVSMTPAATGSGAVRLSPSPMMQPHHRSALDAHVFEDAVDHVKWLLATDVVPRFKKTKGYRRAVRKRRLRMEKGDRRQNE
ncbi:hypothetical protein HK102_002873 [Quaeritorhiza haematococci]|nr:hypothetical protein HK102_002873 [Quaeritorhiza haematococci]